MRLALVPAVVLALALGGCSYSSGQSPSPEDLAKRTKSEATYAAALTDCGLPAPDSQGATRFTVGLDATADAATCFAQHVKSTGLEGAIAATPVVPGSDQPMFLVSVRWTANDAGQLQVDAQLFGLS